MITGTRKLWYVVYLDEETGKYAPCDPRQNKQLFVYTQKTWAGDEAKASSGCGFPCRVKRVPARFEFPKDSLVTA